jgi:hypothetical protein
MSPEMSRAYLPPRKLERKNLDNGRELAIDFYHDLADRIEDRGGECLRSVNELLQLLPKESFVVRRDDPLKVRDLLSDRGQMSLRQDPRLGDKPYANAVEWHARQMNEGLEQAFLEGHGHFEGLVTVAGYRKTDRLQIQKTADLRRSLTDVDRSFSIAVQGELTEKDLAFLIMRTPIDRFDVDDMTPVELEKLEEWQAGPRKPLFVYRAFLFPEHLYEQIAA